MFTATNRFGDEQQLDKYLANILLTTHAARFLVKVLPSVFEKEQLLKAVWMSLVATYVVQGRPRLVSRTFSTLSATSDTYPLERDHDMTIPSMDRETNKIESSIRCGMVAVYAEPEMEHEPESIDSEGNDRWKSLSVEAIHADHHIVPKVREK